MSPFTVVLLAISLLANFLLLVYLEQERKTQEAFRYLKYFIGLQLAYLALRLTGNFFIPSAFVFLTLLLHFGMLSVLMLYSLNMQHENLPKMKLANLVLSTMGIGLIASSIATFFIGGNFLPNFIAKGCLFTGFGCAAYATLKEAKLKKTTGLYALLIAFSLAMLISLLQITPLRGVLASFADAYVSFLFLVAFVMLIENMLSQHIVFLETAGKKDAGSLQNIILSAPSPIILSRLKDDKILLMNEQAKEMFGLPKDVEEVKMKVTELYADAEAKAALMEKLETGKVVDNFEARMKAASGKVKDFWALQSARLMDYGNDIVIFSLFQDITNRKIKEIALFDQATKDPLTGCYNRRQFEEIGLKEFSRAKRSKKDFCLLMIDADHFKKINDTYSHATGDLVLKELANCCHKNVRDSDTVARLGGEEFVILLPETPKETAVKVAEKLRKKISELKIKATSGKAISFTVSIGVSESLGHKEFASILQAADEAMYEAKQTGRNKVVTSDVARNSETQSLLE